MGLSFQTGVSLPGVGPSAFPTLSAQEKAVAGLPSLLAWITPQEAAAKYSGTSLLCRVNKQAGYNGRVQVVGGPGLATGINSNATIAFNGDPAYGLMSGFTMPPSYTIMTVFHFQTDASSQPLIASATTASGDRLFFGPTSGNRLFLAHGAASLTIDAGDAFVDDTVYVAWASYDAATNATAMGWGSTTAKKTGTIATDHKAETSTCIGGATDGAYGLPDDLGPVLIFDRALHLSGYTAQLQAGYDYLNDYKSGTAGKYA